MSKETVLLVSFMHESNTFVENPKTTTRSDFRANREYFGEDVVANLRGTETSVGGVIDVADERGIELRPIAAVNATPGAPVSRDAYEYYTTEIERRVRDRGDDVDGVVMPLHGAMVPEHLHDGEGPLMRTVRDIVGDDVPISISLDLHGNVSDEMLRHADALNAYKEYPHLDKAETGRQGMNVLVDTIRDEVDPTVHASSPPQIIYQPKAYTPSGPMSEIMDRARKHEARDDVLSVSIFPGYYHADVPEMGVTTVAVTDDHPELARRISRDLATSLWERREDFVDEYPGPDEAVGEAKALAAAAGDDKGPVVIGDFGSNPGGGGASDGTTILRAFLEQGVENAGYAIMHDPEVIDTAVAAGVGATRTVTVGGKTDNNHGEPIEDLEVYVKAITDGRFTNTGTSHMGYGVQNDLGPTVYLQCGPDRDIDVVVSGTRHSAFDAEIWRHVGIQPERLDILCIPSFVAFLGDYEPLSSAVVLADTPGVSAVDPARFEYEHIQRPIYPLDDVPRTAFSP